MSLKDMFYEVTNEEMMNVEGGTALASGCVGISDDYTWIPTPTVTIIQKSICLLVSFFIG